MGSQVMVAVGDCKAAMVCCQETVSLPAILTFYQFFIAAISYPPIAWIGNSNPCILLRHGQPTPKLTNQKKSRRLWPTRPARTLRRTRQRRPSFGFVLRGSMSHLNRSEPSGFRGPEFSPGVKGRCMPRCFFFPLVFLHFEQVTSCKLTF